MDHKKRNAIVKECLREYYSEDKIIVIDSSTIQIAAINFIIYNLIFFGNKIVLFKDSFDQIVEISKEKPICKKEEIKINNAKYLLEAIKTDERGNYKIISPKTKANRKQTIINFLKENANAIFYLSNIILYKELKKEKLESQLYFLEMGKVEVNPFQSREFKFETIGAVQFEREKMFIEEKDNCLIKVYNQKGEEKIGKIKDVQVNDYVLIRAKKEGTYSFNLFQIVSKHSRNFATLIIWTDLKNGKKTNKYIDRLSYIFRRMILENRVM